MGLVGACVWGGEGIEMYYYDTNDKYNGIKRQDISSLLERFNLSRQMSRSDKILVTNV